MLPKSGTSLFQECSSCLQLEVCPCAVSAGLTCLTSKKMTLAATARTYLSLGMHFLYNSLQVTELQRYWVSKRTLCTLTLAKAGDILCASRWPLEPSDGHIHHPAELSSKKHILNLFAS